MFTKIKFLLVFYFIFLKVKLCYMFCAKRSKQNKSILFIENFPVESSGYQYRAEKWAQFFRLEGKRADVVTLYEDRDAFYDAFYSPNTSKMLIDTLLKRYKQVLSSRNYETVVVRRELLWFNDYGNLFMDKLLLKFHPNAIIDFDDDIAAAKNQPKEIKNWHGRLLFENGNKFNDTLRLYKRFIVASEYLKNRVLDENHTINDDAICVIPTCVDYDKYSVKNYPTKHEKFVLGWIGGSHNYKQLDLILPLLNKLADKYSFELLVIGGKEYVRDTNFELKFIPWSLVHEVSDMFKIDVGLMPLNDDKITRGKGGFKLLQYMGLGIVSIASPITINQEIVHHGFNSFLCKNDDEWEETFENIFNGQVDLFKIGEQARKTICERYTFNACFPRYKQFLEKL
jgi:glycosyltransferase involved in cell wall biosynthesis